MKLTIKIMLITCNLAAVAAQAQLKRFQHIVVVVQENRTPDNLFHALCTIRSCSANPTAQQYNIQLSNWLDRTSSTGFTNPMRVELANGYDLHHRHTYWSKQCDLNPVVVPPQCRMDGAAGNRANRGAFAFVNNTPDPSHPNGILSSYLTLATQYGWANFMFQTNQGPSYPAHQYIFGGTSALSAAADRMGIFVSENFAGDAAGCYAQDGEKTELIDSTGKQTLFTINHATGNVVCVPSQSNGGRDTMATLLDRAGLSWKYYSPRSRGGDGGGYIWTAPNSLKVICQPDANLTCTGAEWKSNVDLNPSHLLGDALGTGTNGCNLASVSWVIPKGQNSDHPGVPEGGPDWVANVVNAIGESTCTDTIGGRTFSYWQDTAIVITWDDWGGWYDHVPPTILNSPEGGYQLGFRVPLIFVSAYTPVGFIDNLHHDFGTVLRFIEHNFASFGITEGELGFADTRGTLNNFSAFYQLSRTPRKFEHIQSAITALDFMNDKTPPSDPDDD